MAASKVISRNFAQERSFLRVYTIIIFTDAATSPQTKIAIGAFLCLEQRHIDEYTEYSVENLSAVLAGKVVYREYESKKSTWSEIKTVIDALDSIDENLVLDTKVEIYTDCQSLCDLIGRRKEKLEKSNFITRSGKTLQNADLYKELFAITKKFEIKIFKVKGHHAIAHRLTVHERIFDVLDKLSRRRLRVVLK